MRKFSKVMENANIDLSLFIPNENENLSLNNASETIRNIIVLFFTRSTDRGPQILIRVNLADNSSRDDYAYANLFYAWNEIDGQNILCTVIDNALKETGYNAIKTIKPLGSFVNGAHGAEIYLYIANVTDIECSMRGEWRDLEFLQECRDGICLLAYHLIKGKETDALKLMHQQKTTGSFRVLMPYKVQIVIMLLLVAIGYYLIYNFITTPKKQQNPESLTQLKTQSIILKNAAPKPLTGENVPRVSLKKELVYWVTIGSFKHKKNAEKITNRLGEKGHPAKMQIFIHSGRTWYRAVIGQFNNRGDAVKAMNDLWQAEQIEGFIFST